MTLFILSMTILVFAIPKIIALVLGNQMHLPNIEIKGYKIEPDNFFILCPSIMYQVWFWASRMELFS